MNITQEKSIALNAREIATVCDFAMQAADNDGVINSFIYERALWVYAADVIYNERREELAKILTEEGVLATWDMLLHDDTFDAMEQDYPLEIEAISNAGKIWYDDYVESQLSPRGLVDMLTLFSGNIMTEAMSNVEKVANTQNLQETIKIAEDWGMKE